MFLTLVSCYYYSLAQSGFLTSVFCPTSSTVKLKIELNIQLQLL